MTAAVTSGQTFCTRSASSASPSCGYVSSARLAYRFGIDYYGLSSGRRAAWQALWLVVLYAAMMLLVVASGGHPLV